jgi:ubiquinone/menaquinone biosynthesis C-methylase UbiE
MRVERKLQLEQQWHESDHFARDDNSLIVGVYASPVFAEAEAYHLAALGDVAGQRVLDYGCGSGGTTAQLLAQGAQVTGFDISLTRLQNARQRVAGERGGAATGLAQCAAETLPFADGAFDAVLGKQILHHLDLKIAIPEIARVLRPGGRAVFLEPLTPAPTAGAVSTTRSWKAIAASRRICVVPPNAP